MEVLSLKLTGCFFQRDEDGRCGNEVSDLPKNSPYFLVCFRTDPLSGFKYSILRELRFIGMCRIENVYLTKCMFLEAGRRSFTRMSQKEGF